MFHRATIGLLTVAGLLVASPAPAQVFVRAPFVRVEVGNPGVYVRAPFVNIYVPPRPVYYVPHETAPIIGEPLPVPNEVPPPAKGVPSPAKGAKEAAPAVPAAPAEPAKAQTLQEFSRNFTARQGNYDVTIINPVTKQPTNVRFSLPPGNPRRIQLSDDEIEFDYGVRRFVRIRFDEDGAIVTSR